MFLTFTAPLLLAFTATLAPRTAATTQAPAKPTEPAPAPVERVRVPTFANATCPIMGKAASPRLFVDTELGRIYVCCKTCNKDVLADPAHAHKTAYPTVKKLANTVCPVDGAVTDDKSPTVVLQGFELRVHTAACATELRADAQRYLALANDPKLVDIGNATCPISGEAVARNVVAIVDGALVRFSSPKSIEEARKDPAKTLAKARELRAAELEREKKAAPAEPAGSKPAPKSGMLH
jgi:hypothetical protein